MRWTIVVVSEDWGVFGYGRVLCEACGVAAKCQEMIKPFPHDIPLSNLRQDLWVLAAMSRLFSSRYTESMLIKAGNSTFLSLTWTVV